MSSRKYATPLSLRRNPSRIAACLYVSITGFTVILILFIPLPAVAEVALIAIVLGSLVYALSREWNLLAQRSIQSLTWFDGNQWQLEMADQQKLQATLLADSVNLPYLVILNFRVAGQYWPITLILYRDSCFEEALRQLRVRLRVQASEFYKR